GSATAAAARSLAQPALAQALDELPEHERRALELRVVDELPCDQVAAALDIRPGGGTWSCLPGPAAGNAEIAPPKRSSDSFRDKIRALLSSGRSREEGHVTVDGRDAIHIASEGGDMSYLVGAETYDPVEWRTSGSGRSTTVRFVVYEKLDATAASSALLSLTGQHPDAKVDTDPPRYEAAQSRLFRRG